MKKELLSKCNIIDAILVNHKKSKEAIINEQSTNNEDTENRDTNISNVENNHENDIEVNNPAEVNARKNITILGDSTIKHIESYKMRQGMKKNEKLSVKTFLGAKTSFMVDYIKPSQKNKPDVVLLQ